MYIIFLVVYVEGSRYERYHTAQRAARQLQLLRTSAYGVTRDSEDALGMVDSCDALAGYLPDG